MSDPGYIDYVERDARGFRVATKRVWHDEVKMWESLLRLFGPTAPDSVKKLFKKRIREAKKKRGTEK
jgi:hypothetical protein